MPLIKLSSPATRQFWKIEIRYEDDHLLALEKPLDLPLTGDGLTPPTLMALLHRDIERGAEWATSRNLTYLKQAHHLDPSLGGLVIMAKDHSTFTRLADRFGEETPLLDFAVLVQGNPTEDSYDLLNKLEPYPERTGYMRISSTGGKRSRTLIQVVERFQRHALLNCQPLTLRPDQLLVHLKSLRLPVVGDRKYGAAPLLLSRLKPDFHLKPNRKERPLISRPAIHAAKISLNHPSTGQPLTIESPLAKDLTVGLKYLRRFAARD